MPTHATLAAQLLQDAAGFFRNLASENETVREDMNSNADVFDQMAGLMTQEPTGVIDDKPYSLLAAQLLRDASKFFRTLAEDNEPLREQMTENARVFDHTANLVEENPLEILE